MSVIGDNRPPKTVDADRAVREADDSGDSMGGRDGMV